MDGKKSGTWNKTEPAQAPASALPSCTRVPSGPSQPLPVAQLPASSTHPHSPRESFPLPGKGPPCFACLLMSAPSSLQWPLSKEVQWPPLAALSGLLDPTLMCLPVTLGYFSPASSFLQDLPFYQPQIIGVPWTLFVVLLTLFLADLISSLGIYYYL